MNFNALKIIFKIHKKVIKKDPGLILTQRIKESTCGFNTYMQNKREIPAIVNEKIVIKC